MLLARYDRQVAGALFEPIDTYLHSLSAQAGPRDEYDPNVISAKGCIDPQAAVALVESLTPPGDFNRSNPAHAATLSLAVLLGHTAERRWMHLWQSVGVHLDD
jgi:hypothetical protein